MRVAACVVVWLAAWAQAAVLGIDYGTEWFTVALATPGRPLDVVLNRGAKRQTASVVAVSGLERTFGPEAVAMAARMPRQTFAAVGAVLGAGFESGAAAAYRARFPNEMVRDAATGGVAFAGGNGTVLTATELVAMQLQHARQLVRESEGVEARDAVLAVPAVAGRAQRQALVDAAELGGLRVLALVSDGGAAALNYAMGRTFDRAETHVIYDMGASKTVATVARFSARGKGRAGGSKAQTVVAVQAYAGDAALGGLDVDVAARDLLAAKFVRSSGAAAEALRGDARAMTRLLHEARRAKTVLSVNAEATAAVEALHAGADLRARLTRAELEAAVAPLVPRIRAPVDRALAAANVTLDDVASIVLVGGASRMPLVQRALADAFGRARLARSLNADEACVMGAVFRGAALSSHFRVRDMRLRDALPYAVRAAVAGRHVPLLPAFSPVGARRSLRDARGEDLAITFESAPSDDPTAAAAWAPLAEATVTGVAGAAARLAAARVGTAPPEVRVLVHTTELGAFEVVKAEAVFNVTNPAHAKYLADLAAWEAEAAAATESSASDALRPRPPAQPETVTEAVALALDVQYHGAAPMPAAALARSRALLRRMDDDDADRSARHAAANRLESLIYRLREETAEDDDADDGERSSGALAFATAAQRAALARALDAAAEWHDAEAAAAAVAEIEAQAAALHALWDPIAHRRAQHAKRAASVAELEKTITQATAFLAAAREAAPEAAPDQPPPLDPALLDSMAATVAAVEAWLADASARQAALGPADDPVLLAADADAKAAEIRDSLAKVIADKVKRAMASATTTSSSSTSSTSVARDDEDDAPPKTTTTTESPSSEDEPELPKPEGGHDEL
ncbi:lumenal Hsp70 protein [Coemansia javaensis]|uniref:Lumenal Hsp70 protein n=1 Tax=Coemansia javaensis TaxID=2761396 RepID=A0A9W8H649_9FUNG|nr:lumenal Hsp70 protein [Coemansia javaensis]